MNVTVKNFGPALLLDVDTDSANKGKNKTALIQLLRVGPAQNIRVPLEDVSEAEPKSLVEVLHPAAAAAATQGA